MKQLIFHLLLWLFLLAAPQLQASQNPTQTKPVTVQANQETTSKPIPIKKKGTNEEKRKIDIATIISLILGLTAGAIGLAVGSVIVYGIISLIALGFAIYGWTLIRKNPEKYKAEGLAILGVVIGIIGACIGLGIGLRM